MGSTKAAMKEAVKTLKRITERKQLTKMKPAKAGFV
jgi:hypothetical protein